MTDETLPPDRLLASAALDDEVSSAERARVDASAELTEEMRYYGELRTRLGKVDVPTASREQAIVAALAAFDVDHAGADAPAAAGNVVRLADRRRRQYRWLTGAAAAAVIAVVAASIVRSNDDDDSTSVAFKSDSSELAVEAPAPAEVSPAADAGGDEAGEDSADGFSTPATVPGVEAMTEAAGASPAPAVVAPIIATPPVFTTPAEIVAFVQAGFVVPAPLTPPDTSTEAADTTAVAAELDTAVPTDAATATYPAIDEVTREVAVRCAFDIDLPAAAAIYNGVPVVIVYDVAKALISVVDTATCAVTLTLPLP